MNKNFQEAADIHNRWPVMAEQKPEQPRRQIVRPALKAVFQFVRFMVSLPMLLIRGRRGNIVIGIFAVVLAGRFFGTLPTSLAACLLLSPLLAWAMELPPLRKLAPAWRSAGRLACVAIPLMVVMIVAQRKFAAASTAHSRPPEPNVTRDLKEK